MPLAALLETEIVSQSDIRPYMICYGDVRTINNTQLRKKERIMEIIIGIIVLFVIYKVFFGAGAKMKNTDAIIGAAVRLGVPETDATNILEEQMDQLGTMLHITTMKGSTVASRPAHERMAHCIHALYKKTT